MFTSVRAWTREALQSREGIWDKLEEKADSTTYKVCSLGQGLSPLWAYFLISQIGMVWAKITWSTRRHWERRALLFHCCLWIPHGPIVLWNVPLVQQGRDSSRTGGSPASCLAQFTLHSPASLLLQKASWTVGGRVDAEWGRWERISD